jgi:predicted esterase
MLSLYRELGFPDVAAIAPQAAGHTWYPQSFMAPIEENQPFLNSALSRVETIVRDLLARGLRSNRIALLGFSQGACLASEFIAQHPRRYGAVMVLTGGLAGPQGTVRNYRGSLDGTQIFLGTSDPDPHVPYKRVEETRDVLTNMGATVELRRYEGMAHTINDDELRACRELIQSLVMTPRQEL